MLLFFVIFVKLNIKIIYLFRKDDNMNESINNSGQVDNVKYATFGDRIAAFLGDIPWVIVFAIIAYFIITILQLIIRMADYNNVNISQSSFIIILLFIFFGQPIYALFADASQKHATRGKIKRNMYVVNRNGQYLNFGESILRMIIKYIILIIPFGLIISIIIMAYSEKKQALHDLILGQYVIKR